MIPRVKSSFQMDRVLTICGESHLALPWYSLVQNPGSTEFEIACRVSWSKPSPEAPWTKQFCLCDFSAWQTLSHSSSVVGGFRPYLVKICWLIHSIPAYVEPAEIAVSRPFLSWRPLIPIGAIFDFQS